MFEGGRDRRLAVAVVLGRHRDLAFQRQQRGQCLAEPGKAAAVRKRLPECETSSSAPNEPVSGAPSLTIAIPRR
ncbi:hypothetical protein [Amycolatopsis sp. NPDC021455]|uniref:hypothetical protein n=1 Tax=Amycolatopsis sp. NPDC021455 TaxID=3154901 RepID=UPI003402E31C